MKLTLQSHAESDTMRIAARLAAHLVPGDLVALDGPLGAGKTCFVRGLARGLGIEGDVVSSPTFVICQEYATPSGLRLAHADAYRLSGPDELEAIGWEEMLEDPLTLVVIEWPQRIAEALPRRRIDITFTHTGEEDRLLTIEAAGEYDERFAELARRLPIITEHACPACSTTVTSAAEHFPFCSRRCRMVDLGKWMKESYRVSRPVTDSDES
jgi:tRNA threonylcarbamoyl adenosine modification protein YjeE